jgi:hypothetical protein
MTKYLIFALLSLGLSANAADSRKGKRAVPTNQKSLKFKAAKKSNAESAKSWKPVYLTLAADKNLHFVIPVPLPEGSNTHNCRPNRTVTPANAFQDLCGKSLQLMKVAKPVSADADFKAAGLKAKSQIVSKAMPWGKLQIAREPVKFGQIFYRMEAKNGGPVLILKDTFYHKIEFEKFELGAPRAPAAASRATAHKKK